MEIAVYPLGTGGISVSREVSRVLDVLERSRLPYHTTVMGTVVEGMPDALFALARELHSAVFGDTVNRVVTIIRVDECRK